MKHRYPPHRFYISQHPAVEKRIIAELQDVGISVGKSAATPAARQLVFEDLSQLPYLASVIKVRACSLYDYVILVISAVVATAGVRGPVAAALPGIGHQGACM